MLILVKGDDATSETKAIMLITAGYGWLGLILIFMM